MTTENKNIIARCGTYDELVQPNQIQPGQAGFCTDRPVVLYRRRENAPVRPSEIDEFVCTSYINPTVNRNGIVIEHVTGDPENTMQIYNAWAGQVMATPSDYSPDGVPYHAHLSEKLFATGGVEVEVFDTMEGVYGSPKALRFKLASTVKTTDELVKSSSTDTTGEYLIDKLVSSDSTITIELVMDGNGKQTINLKANGGVSGDFLSRDGSNGFEVLMSDPTNVNEGNAFYRESVQTVKVITKSGLDMLMNRQSRLLVVNRTGVPVSAGRAVYLTGWYNGYPTFSLSIANSQATSFISGVTISSMENDAVGEIMGFGILPIDTTGLTVNSMLWLSDMTPGLLTTTAPLFPNFLSLVGRVVIVGNATTGAISIEKGVLPTVSNSGGGGIVDATYIGMEAFPLAMITGAHNTGSNEQMWTAAFARFDTQINRLSALLLAEFAYTVGDYIRFGIADVNGNMLGQTDILTATGTRGIKTLPIENNGVININKNQLYFFTLGSNHNASSWGINTGYNSNEISSGTFAKLALNSINSGISAGRLPNTAQSTSPDSKRIWMIGYKE